MPRILPRILHSPPSFFEPPIHLHPPLTNVPLILASRRLASLKLIQVPSTDVQAPLVIIHALPEVADLGLASASLRRGHVGLVLLREVGRGGLLFSGGRGRAAGEESADGVADRGAYCDTAVIELVNDDCVKSGSRTDGRYECASKLSRIA